MSPIGKIFAVLNLILAAAFLGWASNALSASGKFKAKWEDEVAAHETDSQTWEERESELNAKAGELESARSRFRQEKEDAVNDRDRYKADADSQAQTNSELRASIDKIQGDLGALVAQNKALEESKSTAMQARSEAESERDDAVAATEEAAAAQREAEQTLAVANRDIAELRSGTADRDAQLASLEAKFDTLVDATGASVDELVAQPLIEARVLEVNKTIAPGLVALNVGADQNVKRGYVFHIFRGEAYLGKVRIENVRPTMSTGLIQGTYEGREIRQGDQAATRL
jgi:multidrug efflux pump subunit AcrA (membrane-fusion protein)